MSDVIPDSPLYEEPNMPDAGLDFSYELWTPDTVVTLTNVPWTPTYRDCPVFKTQADVNAYLTRDGVTTLTLEELSYAKPNLPIKLDVGINVAQQYNYISVYNPSSTNADDEPMYYYYFIMGVTYNSPGATTFMLQLDAWVTYGRRAKWGNCYVKRGHIGIANERGFGNYGRDYLTIPEGMDIGNEYKPVLRSNRSVMSGTVPGGANNEIDILVVSAIDLTADPGSRGDNQKPKLNTAKGGNFQGMPSGASYYVFQDVAQLMVFMEAFKEKPWVTQGILSITAIPGLERYGYKLKKIDIPNNPRVNIFEPVAPLGQGHYYQMLPDWRETARRRIPARYRHLSKFLVYPYMVVELTTNTGAPLILKPELWDSADAELSEKAQLAPPNQRVVIYPHRYNALDVWDQRDETNSDGHIDRYDDGGEYLATSVQIGSFPSFALVNNGAIAFLAANQHALQYSRQSADWSQQRALMGNDQAYSQATAGMEAQGEQGRIARNADITSVGISNDMAGLGALASGGASLGNGLMSGTPSGAMGGVLGAGSAYLNYEMTTMGSKLQLGNRNAAAVASQGTSLDLAGYMRDSNKDLADRVAKSNYAMEIAGINAKVQDSALTQPSSSGQAGGEMFNIIHKAADISFRVKYLPPAEMRAMGDYWLRYGYAIRQFIKLPQTLMVMTKFTYWEVTEAYMQGDMPETIKQTLRGILEQGATFWNNPDDIGMIDYADNKPLEGIAF